MVDTGVIYQPDLEFWKRSPYDSIDPIFHSIRPVTGEMHYSLLEVNSCVALLGKPKKPGDDLIYLRPLSRTNFVV